MMNEQEAIILAKEGRREGFARIYELFAGYLFTVAIRILNDRSLAEDVLQETFEAAFKAIGGFEGKSRLKTWLYTILYRTAIHKRSERKAENTLLNESSELHECTSSFADNVERKLLVEEALKILDQREKSMILMYYRDDLSCCEIAQVTDCSESNVKIILFRARKKIEQIILGAESELSDSLSIGGKK
ncbi:MAG: RNA polymerase sigma factor [Candidatus Riflebacteria bacterium]|nr:RNA polymerase sigma factor [Candidatus Riflebacteria bacterium]